MAGLLLAPGYAVVFPDSLSPRGVAQLCTQKIGTRSINQTQRRRGALATLNWVAAQAWATPSKTPPGPCIALGQAVGAEVNVFADSHHDFDNPVGVVKLRKEVPNGVHPGQGVHAGPNPAAREKAYAQVFEALRVAFDSSASELRPLSP